MTEYPKINEFNHESSKLMHIDLNSCFASIEQQANPKLRGLPTVVAVYPTDSGCILAASVEAKKLGIKTGMRVKEAKDIYRPVKILTPDPPKYRYVHQQMMKVFEIYTPDVEPKSIDEAVLIFNRETPGVDGLDSGSLFTIGKEIKQRIKSEIGEWLTVSIGLGPNRFLAKTAASIKKPDGLEEISFLNVEEQLKKLELIDLCGINKALKLKLNLVGVFTTIEFLHADLSTLKTAFKSVGAYHWYKRLRGFETDDWRSSRKSIGHSYALPNKTSQIKELSNILYRLCEKVGRRLRNNNLETKGISLSIVYSKRAETAPLPAGLVERNNSREANKAEQKNETVRSPVFYKDWTRGSYSHKLSQPIFASMDIYHEALKVLNADLNSRSRSAPAGQTSGVRTLSVSVFNLSQSLYQQPTLFETLGVNGLDSGSLAPIRKKSLTRALDEINNRYGEFTITPAPLIDFRKKILDRISFGGIRDMETVV